MNDQKEIEKIKKLTEKKKTAPIIKMMGKADSDVLVVALDALGKIGDEDSFNMITHYLEHEDAKVRVAACKAALVIDTEYMKTHFVSLLRYMADRKQFLKLMDEEADVYSSAADYVEKNGLMVYGFAFVGDKERIQEVNARDEVYQIYTQEMR